MNIDLGFVHRYIEKQGAKKTLLLLHGTGGDENDLITLGEFLDPEASILSPRGKILEHGAPRFFKRLAEGVFDLEDLKFRTIELCEFIQKASVHYQFNLHDLVAVGFSNGANIAASLVLTFPKIIQRAVLFSPMIPFNPQHLADLSLTKVFIGAGKADHIIPPQKTQQLEKLLIGSEAKVSTYWHDGGHQIDDEEVNAAKEWLKQS